MSDYETVNNPYDQNPYPGVTYPAPAPAPAPATAPPGWAQAPDGSWVQVPVAPVAPAPAPAPVATTPVPAPVSDGGYPTGQTAAAPLPAGAPPPVPPASAVQQQTHERKQMIEQRTQSGEPLEQLNLVMMTGYFHHMRDQQGNPKFVETGNSVRLGFSLAEKQTWTDKDGQTQVRVVWHRCQAWNDYARVLIQVQDGTPIKIWGNLTRFYMRDDQGNITGELVDIKINKYDFP